MFPATHTIGGGGIKIAPNPWADRTYVRLSDAEGMDGAATFNSPAGGPARWPLNGPRVAVCAVHDDSARNETPAAAAAAAAGAASTAIDTDYDVFRPRRIRSDGKVQMPSRRRSIENRTARRRRRRRRRRKVSAAEFTASRKTADAIVCRRSGDGHRRAGRIGDVEVSRPDQSCPWVVLTHGLGWVRLVHYSKSTKNLKELF